MAIEIERHFDGEESAGWNFNGNKRIRDYSISWRAKCSANETAYDVLYSDELFFVTDNVHEQDSLARIVSKTCTIEKGAKTRTYICTATYSSDKEKGNRSPLYPDTPAVVSYQWQERLIPVSKDLDDKPIVNTAGDPFDPPLEINVPILVKTIQVGLTPSEAATYLSPAFSRAVNAGYYDGWEPGYALLQECNVDPAVYTDDDDEEIEYAVVTTRIAFDPLGYNPVKKLNSGYNEINDDDEKVRILLPGDSSEASCPIPLDEDGKALFGADVESNAHYLEFNLYNEVSFSVFEF